MRVHLSHCLASILRVAEKGTLPLGRSLQEEEEPEEPSTYPDELFTDDQLKSGAIALHIIGCIYTFLALSIVCDTFFVPALEVMIEVF